MVGQGQQPAPRDVVLRLEALALPPEGERVALREFVTMQTVARVAEQRNADARAERSLREVAAMLGFEEGALRRARAGVDARADWRLHAALDRRGVAGRDAPDRDAGHVARALGVTGGGAQQGGVERVVKRLGLRASGRFALPRSGNGGMRERRMHEIRSEDRIDFEKGKGAAGR